MVDFMAVVHVHYRGASFGCPCKRGGLAGNSGLNCLCEWHFTVAHGKMMTTAVLTEVIFKQRSGKNEKTGEERNHE